MFRLSFLFVILAAFSNAPSPANATEDDVVDHDIQITIDPESSELYLIDRVKFPAGSPGPDRVLIDISMTLSIENAPGQARLESSGASGSHGLKEYSLYRDGSTEITLKATGRWPKDYDPSRGHVSSKGVYLPPHGGWMPVFPENRVRFQLAIHLPQGWVGVSQGDALSDNAWLEHLPQPGIWIVAGRYFRHEATHGDTRLHAFLFSPEPDLSEKYFQEAGKWLDRYDSILGAYPYKKLSVIENFWASGYGMPSFALLGSEVLRLPFIPTTAWPHEILHNWFGNGVYVGDDGNWSEGLTAYVADHAIRELDGSDTHFRRDTLQKFMSYVQDDEEIPLAEFRFRHDGATAAIGYDKSLMVIHMLRRRTGDRSFRRGLKIFIDRHMHQNATWQDLNSAMAESSGENLDAFFTQWLNRRGAPVLKLKSATADINCANGQLIQTQSGELYDLRVPLFVTFEGEVIRQNIWMQSRQKDFSICADSKPLRIDVDPEFDVFRRLDTQEVPATVSELTGSKDVIGIVPSQATPDELKAWLQVTEQAGIKTVQDRTLGSLPEHAGIWILGKDNQFADSILNETEVKLTLQRERVTKNKNALVVTRRRGDQTIGLASIPPGGDAPSLLRRVQHYGNYSYLAFRSGDRVASTRGQWAISQSPMAVIFDTKGGSSAPDFPRRSPLVEP